MRVTQSTSLVTFSVLAFVAGCGSERSGTPITPEPKSRIGNAIAIAQTGRILAPDAKSEIRALSKSEQLKRAYAAVFPKGGTSDVDREDTTFSYEGGGVIWASFGLVLIAPAANKNAYPASSGALGIFYLTELKGKFVVRKSWLATIGGSIMGEPPERETSAKFGDMPVVISKAAGFWQGIARHHTSVVGLYPDVGPRPLASFHSFYDNGGAEQNPNKIQAIEGTIENVIAGNPLTSDLTERCVLSPITEKMATDMPGPTTAPTYQPADLPKHIRLSRPQCIIGHRYTVAAEQPS